MTTKPRVFKVSQGTLSEISPRQMGTIKWTDTISNEPTATIQLLPNSKTLPANIPEQLLIVPSQREILQVPVYGPYESRTPRWTGETWELEGAIGIDFAERFATNESRALLANLVAEIKGYSTSMCEPFQQWTEESVESDGPLVAKLGTKNQSGADALTSIIGSTLYNVGNLSELDGLLNSFGLLAYVLIEWPPSGVAWFDRLALWPLHPIQTDDGRYYVQPRLGVIDAWTEEHLPFIFISPNFTMPNTVSLANVDLSTIEYHPAINISHLLNAPHGSKWPSWRTRKINVATRLLGIEQDVVYFFTGSREPALFRSPQPTNAAGLVKIDEELQRWNLQNNAATLTLKRLVNDEWDMLTNQFFVPHQILTMPTEIFPEGWPDNDRDFVVREVMHEFTPEQGYSQTISATLWQGPFDRLKATLEEFIAPMTPF